MADLGSDSTTKTVTEIVLQYREDLREWRTKVGSLKCRDVQIQSFDGLTLRGKYYEYKKGAPVEILMHGYRGSMGRDMDGGVFRCFLHGKNALAIDHRGSGTSDGKVISFGINESRDCEEWIKFVINKIDPNAKIILAGVSMGAATVMITAGKDLPKNVVAVVADCGYTSAKDIIMNTMRDMKLPPKLLYPFARLGARLYGNFDIDETSPIEMLRKAKVPVIFFHGDSDTFVPYEMGKRNYEACASKKVFVTVEGAGHAVCFPHNKEKYLSELKAFLDPILNEE